jgi:hypothetical protein
VADLHVRPRFRIVHIKVLMNQNKSSRAHLGPVVRWLALALALSGPTHADAQTRPTTAAPRKFEITDNSFLVEEAFNQESGVFQNIFAWQRDSGGVWGMTFTQEWPAPNMTHQFSYTIPATGVGTSRGFGDVLVNYRFQVLREKPGRPAIAPRVSIVLPTGREVDGFGNGVVGWQVNVPFSKQFGDIYLHANAGVTWLPGAAIISDGTSDSLTSPQLAASAIWRATPMLNLMLEAVGVFAEAVEDRALVRSRSVTISPGFRRGWNVGERQIVFGAALPITRMSDTVATAVLLYGSYELPFK